MHRWCFRIVLLVCAFSFLHSPLTAQYSKNHLHSLYRTCERVLINRHWDSLEVFAHQGLQLTDSLEEERWHAHFAYILGSAHIKRYEIKEGDSLLNQALLHEADLPDSILCTIFYHKSTVYSKRDFQASRDWLQKALATTHSQRPSIRFRMLNRLGNLVSNEGQYDSATVYYKKAYQVALAGKDTVSAARIIGNMGMDHYAFARYDSAQVYSQRSIDYLVQTNREGRNNVHLGFAYILRGDILGGYEGDRGTENRQWRRKAHTYYEQGVALLLQSDNLNHHFIAYQCLYKVELEKEEFEAAIATLEKAANIAKEMGMIVQEGECLLDLGDVAEKMKKPRSAAAYYEAAIPIMQEAGQRQSLAIALTKLANITNEQGQHIVAEGYVKEAISIQQSLALTSDLMTSYRVLATIHSSKNEFRQAYQWLASYEQLKDSLFNEEKNHQITELETQYETVKKEAALVQSEQALLLEQATGEVRKKQLMGLLLLLGVLLLAGAGAIFAYRRISSQKKQIEAQSAVVSESLKEKEILLREIHHRVKNNLQTISSLLKLQARNLEGNEQVRIPLLEGRNRVKSMALIHQKLYQTEDLRQVDFQDYLVQLSKALASSYRDKARNVQVHVDAAGIDMDIDTAVPLGLIVNELLSNSYKYAFEGRSEGNIHLSMKSTAAGKGYELSVADDGVGLPDGFKPEESESLGLQLVTMLSQQLEGNLQWVSEQGSKFVLTFNPAIASLA